MQATDQGTAIGRYTILERIAVGGMAELFRAKVSGDHGFEKLVAIKRIHRHLASDPQFVSMFLDEARITAQLDHPNIVSVYELGTDVVPFMAMQLVEGLDVLSLLRECARTQIRLPVELAVYIAHEVLAALDYAHHATGARGEPLSLVHRDVSPGNVLLSWRGNVKLTDFGIARAAERQHQTDAGTLKGKYGYMSPEQVSGADLDGRSDVFALGVLLAELIMARRVFVAENDLDLLLMVRDARVDRIREFEHEFPPDLLPLIGKALRRDPSRRWATAGAMREGLRTWLGDRADAHALAAFLAEVAHAPTHPLAEGVVLESIADIDAMSTRYPSSTGATPRPVLDPTTLDEALGDPPGADSHGDGPTVLGRALSLPEIEDDDDVATNTTPLPTLVSRETGTLDDTTVIALLHRLVAARTTGLLQLYGDGGVVKETYLVGGHPQFVHSNVEAERLGPFLLAEGVIDRATLTAAEAAMQAHQGRLIDTLIAQGAMNPLDAYRHLSKQVAAKLIDACGWTRGRWAVTCGEPNPWNAESLHLDGYRIIGAGALRVDLALVEPWFLQHTRALVVGETVRGDELARYGLGDVVARVHALLDGRATLGDVVARARSNDARTNLQRMIYFLTVIGLARISR